MEKLIFNCAICNKSFDDRKSLHRHVRFDEKMRLEDYYIRYFPRVDKYSGQAIPFTDVETYLNSAFINRENLNLYLKSNKEKAAECIKELLQIKIKDKKITFAPSFVEAASTILPTPFLCESIGIDYNQICKEVGLITKYNYKLLPQFNNTSEVTILTDSREQRPYTLANNILTTLNFADITVKNEELFCNLFIEVKRNLDFVSSMTSGLDRIKRELDRAKSCDSYIVILTNLDLKSALNLQESSYYKRFTRVSSEYLFHNVRELCQLYPNIQFVFTKTPEKTIEKIFRLGERAKKLDLMFLMAKGLF